jgi:AAA family ATP:ADP antiporter
MTSSTGKEHWPMALLLGAMAYVILASYAIARPAIESIYLAHHSAETLPSVWLAVAAAAIIVVSAYNRACARHALATVFGWATVGSAVILVALLTVESMDDLSPSIRAASAFMLYVWKDVYIVVLIEIFWSYANVNFPPKSARRTYGLFCAAGSLGGMSGNFGVGWLAIRYGTSATLWAVIPLLALAWGGCRLLENVSSEPPPRSTSSAGWKANLRVLTESRYLPLILALIVTVQVVITLVDYEVNTFLQATYPDKDVRTNMIGTIYGSIDVAALILQGLTGPILRILGLGSTMLAIPVLVAGAVAAAIAAPRFLTVAASKIVGKCLDYSLFRAGKEMFYLPLNYAEKTQGKALVDMLTYRVAKGACALLLQALIALGLVAWAGPSALGLIVVWIVLTVIIVRRHREVESAKSELLEG